MTEQVVIPLDQARVVALHYCRTVCDRRRPQTHDPACIFALVEQQAASTAEEGS